MNPFSLIIKFLAADMTGRISRALGLDHTAKRSMLIACSVMCLGLAVPTSSFAQTWLKEASAMCGVEWHVNKAFNQAAGITERVWMEECRAEEYARERSCAADWKAAKAAGRVTGGMTWPIFWRECDQSKKAIGK